MKRGMSIEYLKCRADLNFEADFGVNMLFCHGCDCDELESYFIRIMDRTNMNTNSYLCVDCRYAHNKNIFFNTHHVPLCYVTLMSRTAFEG